QQQGTEHGIAVFVFGKIIFKAAAIDADRAVAVAQPDAGHGGLPSAGAKILGLPALFGHVRVLPHFAGILNSTGCWAWCGWLGPACIFSWVISWPPSRFRGTILFTACSKMNSGFLASTSRAPTSFNPPG